MSNENKLNEIRTRLKARRAALPSMMPTPKMKPCTAMREQTHPFSYEDNYSIKPNTEITTIYLKDDDFVDDRYSDTTRETIGFNGTQVFSVDEKDQKLFVTFIKERVMSNHLLAIQVRITDCASIPPLTTTEERKNARF